MKTVQKALNWCMDKQTGRLAYNGILLSDRKEQTTDVYNNMDKSQKHLWWIKKARHNELHTLWFPLLEDILEKAEL